MVDETPNLSENKIYYYVKTCSNADCKKAIAKAITARVNFCVC